MGRSANIKWSDKDERELSRLVKNFNAKVKRLEDKEPLLKDERPKRISKKELKEQIATRQDFNRVVKSHQRFMERGSEAVRITKGGAATTQWQYKEAAIMQRAVTAARRKKRENIKSWQRQESETLFDKPKVDAVKGIGFMDYVKSLEREVASRYDDIKKQMLLENYITGAKKELGPYAAGIEAHVRQMSIDTFVDLVLTSPFLTIDFLYTISDPQERAYDILAQWQAQS